MTVLEQVEVKLEWRDLNALTYHPRKELERSLEFPHVSDILRHVAQTNRQYTEEDRADEMPLRILLGLAFEEAAGRLYPTATWQPGPFEFDGVIGSPDYIDVLPQGWVVDEYKYTGKSLRLKGAKPLPDGSVAYKDIRTEWTWMQQVQSYINIMRRLYPVKFRHLNLGRLHVCYKFGAYVYPMMEVYMRYLIQFNESELLGNWSMLQVSKNSVDKQSGR